MAIAFKLVTKVNTGYYFPGVIAPGNYNAQVLVPVTVAFISISWAGVALKIALALVNIVFGQHFFYFGLVNVAALHTAAGMFGVN
jgi:hypothetical protein